MGSTSKLFFIAERFYPFATMTLARRIT